MKEKRTKAGSIGIIRALYQNANPITKFSVSYYFNKLSDQIWFGLVMNGLGSGLGWHNWKTLLSLWPRFNLFADQGWIYFQDQPVYRSDLEVWPIHGGPGLPYASGHIIWKGNPSLNQRNKELMSNGQSCLKTGTYFLFKVLSKFGGGPFFLIWKDLALVLLDNLCIVFSPGQSWAAQWWAQLSPSMFWNHRNKLPISTLCCLPWSVIEDSL